jgi:hypothetical protein
VTFSPKIPVFGQQLTIDTDATRVELELQGLYCQLCSCRHHVQAQEDHAWSGWQLTAHKREYGKRKGARSQHHLQLDQPVATRVQLDVDVLLCVLYILPCDCSTGSMLAACKHSCSVCERRKCSAGLRTKIQYVTCAHLAPPACQMCRRSARSSSPAGSRQPPAPPHLPRPHPARHLLCRMGTPQSLTEYFECANLVLPPHARCNSQGRSCAQHPTHRIRSAVCEAQAARLLPTC